MASVQRLGLPPHSIEAEQALLGSLMLDATAWSRIASKIRAADFYRKDHRIIFAAIATLQDKHQAIDAVTINGYLEHAGTINETGGLSYLGRLVRDTPSATNVESYATLVRESAVRRDLKVIGDRISDSSTDVGDRSAAELVANAQQALHDLQISARTGKGLIDAKQLVGEFTDDLDTRSRGSTGLRLGLPDLDELTCGLEPGDLVIFAGRPAMGKTALLVTIGSVSSQTTGTAVFSAEMPSAQLMRRCVSLQTEIPQGLLRRPEKLTNDDWSKISRAAGVIAQRKLWIDDTAAPSLSHIRSETIALKARASLGLVLVDYVQLVRGPGSNRYEQLRDVAYGLKALAKELAVPIIVLAQLNRGVENREFKRPHISDLRDSGGIEEAADIIGLLYAEGYYDSDFSMPYVLECAIEKNRNGERGHCLWRFDGAHSRVTELESGAAAQYRRLLSKPQQRAKADL
jgi:replicative DNA helicase